MGRKEGLRDGEGGLTGGNAQVSLRVLLLFIFFDTDSLFRSAGKAITTTITDSCTYLFTLFNYPYFDTSLSAISSTVASRRVLHQVPCRALF